MLGIFCRSAGISAALVLGASSLMAVTKDDRRTIFEIAPLKGAMGQVAMRVERQLTSQLAYGIGYESIEQPGQRADMEDKSMRLHSDFTWYPELEGAYRGVFMGMGLIYEKAELGRQQSRLVTSGDSPPANQTEDRWVNNVDYLSVSQSVGYRYEMGAHFTTSLRLVVDELIYQKSSTSEEETYSYDVDTAAQRRDPVKQYLVLLTGISF